ncbi:hypothetical protein A2239_04085 [Candidatus Uhrbacteria bacterium RIFOXYA2_FULL_40_9]|nr:MAG: NAD+ synthetase [Candidatus Uhrbacteria bacterium GW2011_GWF2_40_263]OGL94197.1 MAG: hypothetical protein A2239_04085 [Candidatus Uhrbacteria bacterium RIFOXYA2_FULL_40_9]OGL98211.1 MAG: hypothetical protein A2332_03840 [Candidatus Uhrbacteria bacterium RIFOXYB2_FULL_41_18]HBK35171.1 NAD(+) synthase [Candidatus Uhrbacteria bacterium]HCB56043.1 NAD(+) synthase [Candidatus Uhrbacteria bacterium]
MRNSNLPFVRVASAVHEVAIANVPENVKRLLQLVDDTHQMNGADLIVFPELCLTGYSCGELFKQEILLSSALEGLDTFSNELRKRYLQNGLNQYVVVGLPLRVRNMLFNVAAVVHSSGKVMAFIPKTLLPNGQEFYEARWFASADQLPPDVKTVSFMSDEVPIGTDLLIETSGHKPFTFGVEICEDIWGVINPSQFQALGGATILVNTSASTRVVGKKQIRKQLVASQSGRCIASYVYASCGAGESTTDVVWSGHLLIAERGRILKQSVIPDEAGMIVQDVDVDALLHDRQDSYAFRQQVTKYHDVFRHISLTPPPVMTNSAQLASNFFEEISPLCRFIDPHPFVPSDPATCEELCEEIVGMQVSALKQRLKSVNGGRPISSVIGVSGGADSTLTLLIAVQTYDELGWDRSLIHAYTMPGPGTTSRTKGNAFELMEGLGVTVYEEPIEALAAEALRRTGHKPCWKCLKCENAQARARTMILMSTGYFVLGTGDLTEIALGWCTYNADHMSMYNVNASLPKTLVKHVIRYLASQEQFACVESCLRDVLLTPVSPELIKTDGEEIIQKSEDILGPYELHDFYLYWFVRFGKSPEVIAYLAMEAFAGNYHWNQILDTLLIFYKRFGRGSQFKRDCVPGGPKIGTVSLSPRGDWRMPSEADFSCWISMVESLPRYPET